jgi:soluble lytic murein transglycosylase
MYRFLYVVLILVMTPPALADPTGLRTALDALRSQDREQANATLRAINDPLARDIVLWFGLREGYGTFDDYQGFLSRNPDWPGLALMRRQGEYSIPPGADADAVITYFNAQDPSTASGVLALAQAWIQSGEQDRARDLVTRAWVNFPFSPSEAESVYLAHGDILNQGRLHIERLDQMLWQGADDSARAMFAYVPEDWHHLATARIGLRTGQPGVDDLIEAVPAALQDDPGLAYERYFWRLRAGYWDRASELLEQRSQSAASLGQPVLWAQRRADLARDVMRDGNFRQCYTRAANHHITAEDNRSLFADLEWVAGYCAYRRNQFETAITHFTAFLEAVNSPISLGRAGYWLGRAYEGVGNIQAAQSAYAFGAEYQSSFYGQLAAERGGFGNDPAFLGTEDFGDWRGADFTSSEVFHAALLLLEAGEDALAERFLTHLSENLTRIEAGQLATFALEFISPHMALMIAKRIAQNGFAIMRAYYPMADLPADNVIAPLALTLSIARRESEFDHDVISGAGAMGLMQVMPGTAQQTAAEIGVDYDRTRLLNDPNYNALIGSTYLQNLLETYDANLVLVAAAYNAGPGRVAEWIERFGDPRQMDDITYWIEALPFSETRNYVMRVTESVPIYEAQIYGILPGSSLMERLSR